MSEVYKDSLEPQADEEVSPFEVKALEGTLEEYVNFEVLDIDDVVNPESRIPKPARLDFNNPDTWYSWGEFEILTGEQEIRLCQIIEKGRRALFLSESGIDHPDFDKDIQKAIEAKTHFIYSNMRLALKYGYDRSFKSTPGYELRDMQIEAMFGIAKAIDKFDWRAGFKFSTYASWWMKHEIDRSHANQAYTIRLPVHVLTDVSAATRYGSLETSEHYVSTYNVTNLDSLDRQLSFNDDSGTVGEYVEDAESSKGYDSVVDQDSVDYIISKIEEIIREHKDDETTIKAANSFMLRYGIKSPIIQNGQILLIYNEELSDNKKSFKQIGEIIGTEGEVAARLCREMTRMIRLYTIVDDISTRCLLDEREVTDLYRWANFKINVNGHKKLPEVISVLNTVFGTEKIKFVINNTSGNPAEKEWLENFFGLKSTLSMTTANAQQTHIGVARAKDIMAEALTKISLIY